MNSFYEPEDEDYTHVVVSGGEWATGYWAPVLIWYSLASNNAILLQSLNFHVYAIVFSYERVQEVSTSGVYTVWLGLGYGYE